MAIKIKVSFTEEHEAAMILGLLKPIIPFFKVKKSNGTPPFKHLFFNPRNTEKALEYKDIS